MKHTLALTALLITFLLAGSTAQAQSRIEVGPRAGFDIAGDVEEFFLGADGRLGLPGLPIVLNGTFDFYFPDDFDFFQLSLNAFYEFNEDNQTFTPYVGGGIGISRLSRDLDTPGDDDNTEVGVNLLGGAVYGFGNIRPFAQAQITFGDADLVTIAGGLLFRIGE